MPENPSEPERKAHPLGVALSIGTELVVAVVLGLFAGKWIDRKLGSEPVGLLIGTFAGIIVGLYQLVSRTKLPQGGAKKRD